MKYIELTQGKKAIVDDLDFEYLNQFHWSVDGSGYPQRATKMNGKWRPIRMHRDLLRLKEGEHADHIDTNKLNHQRNNLRKCTQAQNNRNMPITKVNTSGYKGVWFRKDKWRRKRWTAEIIFNSKKIYLGSFKTAKEGGIAYNSAAFKYFGAFAYLNKL